MERSISGGLTTTSNTSIFISTPFFPTGREIFLDSCFYRLFFMPDRLLVFELMSKQASFN